MPGPAQPDRINCPIARSLDLLGDRWSLLIIRELLLAETAKFSDLEANIVGASPSQISQKLKRLENAGLVARRFYSQHPPRAEYLLTGRGRELAPVVLALRAFGSKNLPPAGAP